MEYGFNRAMIYAKARFISVCPKDGTKLEYEKPGVYYCATCDARVYDPKYVKIED